MISLEKNNKILSLKKTMKKNENLEDFLSFCLNKRILILFEFIFILEKNYKIDFEIIEEKVNEVNHLIEENNNKTIFKKILNISNTFNAFEKEIEKRNFLIKNTWVSMILKKYDNIVIEETKLSKLICEELPILDDDIIEDEHSINVNEIEQQNVIWYNSLASTNLLSKEEEKEKLFQYKKLEKEHQDFFTSKGILFYNNLSKTSTKLIKDLTLEDLNKFSFDELIKFKNIEIELIELRNLFIISNLKLIDKIARNFVKAKRSTGHLHNLVEVDDFTQWGIKGICDALRKYDPKFETKLSTIATRWIYVTCKTNFQKNDAEVPLNSTDYQNISNFTKKVRDLEEKLGIEQNSLPKETIEKLKIECKLNPKIDYFKTYATSIDNPLLSSDGKELNPLNNIITSSSVADYWKDFKPIDYDRLKTNAKLNDYFVSKGLTEDEIFYIFTKKSIYPMPNFNSLNFFPDKDLITLMNLTPQKFNELKQSISSKLKDENILNLIFSNKKLFE
ncbi:MAG: hypothetical protein ACRC4M_04085 [Mycoplasma sp.]